MKSKDQAILGITYVKELSNLMRKFWGQNSGIKTVKLLEITESICSFYGCLPTCKKSVIAQFSLDI